jgi:hypothetical protein
VLPNTVVAGPDAEAFPSCVHDGDALIGVVLV